MPVFLPSHFTNAQVAVVSLDAGGSTIPISWHLTRPERGTDRPRHFITTNRGEQRLHHIAEIHARMAVDVRFE